MKYSMKKLSVLLGLFLGTYFVDVLSSDKTFKVDKPKEATEVSEKVENFLLNVCCFRRRRKKRRIDEKRLIEVNKSLGALVDRLFKLVEDDNKTSEELKNSKKAIKEAEVVIERMGYTQIEQKNKAAEGSSGAD